MKKIMNADYLEKFTRIMWKLQFVFQRYLKLTNFKRVI